MNANMSSLKLGRSQISQIKIRTKIFDKSQNSKAFYSILIFTVIVILIFGHTWHCSGFIPDCANQSLLVGLG